MSNLILQKTSQSQNMLTIVNISTLFSCCYKTYSCKKLFFHCFRCIEIRKCLALYCFLIRAHNQQKEVWDEIDNLISFRQLHVLFYQYKEAILHEMDSSYNTHNFLHVPHYVKHHGPLWKVSAERFEDLYGFCKRLYKGGTNNTPKQILETFLMHQVDKHRCAFRRSPKINIKKTLKRNDSIVMTGNDFFQVYAISDDILSCHPIKIESLDTSFLGINLPWDKVGVFHFKQVDDTIKINISKKDVTGKGIKILDKFLTSCPNEWVNHKCL